MRQENKPRKMFCWQCGRSLCYVNGAPVFKLVTLPGGNQVKVHRQCESSAVNYQRFDTTPEPGEYYPRKRGQIE